MHIKFGLKGIPVDVKVSITKYQHALERCNGVLPIKENNNSWDYRKSKEWVYFVKCKRVEKAVGGIQSKQSATQAQTKMDNECWGTPLKIHRKTQKKKIRKKLENAVKKITASRVCTGV